MKIKIRQKEPMKRHTTWRIGGPADYFCQPSSGTEIQEALTFAKENNLKTLVLGNGSNILFPDDGFRGLVIKTLAGLDKLSIDGEIVTAGPGIILPVLLDRLAKEGLSGLEYMAGVPGSLGGAVVMNMGAFGEEISHHLLSVKCITAEGKDVMLDREALKFGYRQSILQGSGHILYEIKLRLNESTPAEVMSRIKETLANRKKKHPLELPNAGSVFKNPKPLTAGELIDKVGLKGYRVGDAQISKKHANFIVNLGQATSADVLKLIDLVRTTVKKKCRILLEPEIKIVVN